MKIQTNLEKYLNDYQEVANLFFPNFENQDEHKIEINISREDNNSFDLKIVFDSQEKDFHYDYISNQKNVEDFNNLVYNIWKEKF